MQAYIWYVESLENLYNTLDGDFLRRHQCLMLYFSTSCHFPYYTKKQTHSGNNQNRGFGPGLFTTGGFYI